jgi:hypothetical protein
VAEVEKSGLAESLVAQVLAVGIGGRGAFKGARAVADEHLATYRDPDQAVRKLVATHVRLAAASGFVTGLGGIAALPVTVPAALAGLYILSGRMTAAIAHVRGYDVDSAEVRSAVLVALLGGAGVEVLREVGVTQGRSLVTALHGKSLAGLNRRVGLRLVAKAGEKGLLNLGKLIPFVGAPIGATIDGVGCRAIATYATAIFEPIGRTPPTLRAEITEVIIHRPDM